MRTHDGKRDDVRGEKLLCAHVVDRRCQRLPDGAVLHVDVSVERLVVIDDLPSFDDQTVALETEEHYSSTGGEGTNKQQNHMFPIRQFQRDNRWKTCQGTFRVRQLCIHTRRRPSALQLRLQFSDIQSVTPQNRHKGVDVVLSWENVARQ